MARVVSMKRERRGTPRSHLWRRSTSRAKIAEVLGLNEFQKEAEALNENICSARRRRNFFNRPNWTGSRSGSKCRVSVKTQLELLEIASTASMRRDVTLTPSTRPRERVSSEPRRCRTARRPQVCRQGYNMLNLLIHRKNRTTSTSTTTST